MPEISVIMGVYSQSPDTSLLCRAVRSILEQSFIDFEFIICDDGSCKEVMLTLDKFSYYDKRIMLLREGSNFTLPKKLNYCLKFAKGRYIARMDDDDYSMPERFERQLQFLSENPNVAFAGCNVLLNRDEASAGKRNFPQYPTKKDFRFAQPFIHPTIIFRGSVLDVVGGYSEGKRQILCEDYDLLLRIYERGFKGSNLQEYLLEYTLPPKGKSRRKFQHRFNEMVTRWQRFKALRMLPGALPYVVKPLIVGLIPAKILENMKEHRDN